MRAEFLSGFRLIDRAGHEIQFSVRKAKALFAYLTLNSDRFHSREKLAHLLWNAAGDRAARQSLRKCLSDLRRALGPSSDRVLVVAGDRIRIAPETVNVDVLSFKRHVENDEIENAVEFLQNAELLDGLEIVSEPFEEWLSVERTRHREMAVEALYAAAENLSRKGALLFAIKAAQRVLTFDPLCEEAHRLLIDLFNKIGRPGAARQQYAQCAEVLREGLGVAPSIETREATFPAGKGFRISRITAKPTVVVRNLKCLGKTDVEKQFTAGLFDDLVTELSRYRWLSVIPGGDSGRYIVDGTARFAANRYRVAVHLLTGADGATLWSKASEGRACNMLDVQTEITRIAAARLVMEIERNERHGSSSPAEDESAIDYWLRGKDQFFRYSKESRAAAKRLFAQSIKLDPEFAPAYASMAHVEQMDAFFDYSGSRQASLARGLKLARKAIALDPSDGYVHMALGKVLTRLEDFDSATVEIETALALCPSMDSAQIAYGLTLFYQGRQAEALERFDRAIRMNPQSPQSWAVRHIRARCCYDLGQFDNALRWADRAVNAPHAKTIAVVLKAAAAERAGYDRLARRTVADVIRRDPTMTAAYILEIFGNEYVADKVEDMVDHLRRAGLPD